MQISEEHWRSFLPFKMLNKQAIVLNTMKKMP